MLFISKRQILGFICFTSLLLLTACGEKTLYTVQTESEAVEMIVVLKENGVSDVDKKIVGDEQKKQYEVYISEGVFGNGSYYEALRILHSYCLPYEKPDEIQTKGLVDASEILKSKTQRQRKIEIIQQLRKTVPGVTCIDLTFTPQPGALERLNPNPSTAGVSLNYKNSPPSFTNEQIKSLVARSIPELKVENVEVQSFHLQIEPARLESGNNLKIIILAATSIGLMFFVILILLFMQKRRKTEPEDDENSPDDNSVALLGVGDDDEEEA